MRVESTSGVSLELHDLGGRGDTLLIAHATGLCGRAYDPLAAVLRERFHVWAVDFRGHGDSPPPPDGDFHWGGMGDDVLAVVDALGGRPLHGFGHSMGGAALALAELARPGAVLRSVYLFEPIIFPAVVADAATGAENPMSAAARRRRPEFASKAEALLRYAARPPLGVLRADALAAYVEHGFADIPAERGGGVRLKCLPESEARTFEAPGKPSTDDVQHMKTPAVVGMGERAGPMEPARFAPAVAEALPAGRLVQYAHLGHFGPLQDPETIAADVIAHAVSSSGS
jgi:pimeloyl-ACP methyl ester carboxylesterase